MHCLLAQCDASSRLVGTVNGTTASQAWLQAACMHAAEEQKTLYLWLQHISFDCIPHMHGHGAGVSTAHNVTVSASLLSNLRLARLTLASVGAASSCMPSKASRSASVDLIRSSELPLLLPLGGLGLLAGAVDVASSVPVL